jgi:hypothetical protein
VVNELERDEHRRRANGSRATTLSKLLVKRGLLTEKEIAAAKKAARESQEPVIAAKDLEAVRKAQQDLGGTLERVLVKLSLSSE